MSLCSPSADTFSSVQSLSRVWLFVTPWTAARQASLFITNSQSSPKPMSIESVMPSNHLILRRPLLLLPSIFPSIRVFSNESAFHIRWPKYRSFSFRISPSNEHPGLISFRMDWLDLLAVQGTLKTLLQHRSSKVSILQRSAFFIVQLTHPYMTTGKTIALTRRTFVDKVMSLLFNMLSRLVIKGRKCMSLALHQLTLSGVAQLLTAHWFCPFSSDTGLPHLHTLSLLGGDCYCCLITQLCPILCEPMDCSTQGFADLHLEFAQTCPLSQWCHPTISSSVFSCPQQ